MATVAQLAYELSLRARDQQEASLRELRARTGTLLAASSLTASFLGAPALAGGVTVPLVLALAAFVAAMVLCLVVVLPTPRLVFALDAIRADELLSPLDEEAAYRKLARWTARCHYVNEPVIEQLLRRFELAAASVVGEVVLLALALTLT